MTPRFKRSIVTDVFGVFFDLGAEFGMADLAAEDGGAEGKGRGREGDKENEVSATADPVGPEAEEDQTGEAAEPGNVEERGGLFGHFLAIS